MCDLLFTLSTCPHYVNTKCNCVQLLQLHPLQKQICDLLVFWCVIVRSHSAFSLKTILLLLLFLLLLCSCTALYVHTVLYDNISVCVRAYIRSIHYSIMLHLHTQTQWYGAYHLITQRTRCQEMILGLTNIWIVAVFHTRTHTHVLWVDIISRT